MSELLRGQKVPSLETVERIANALEIEPWRLLRDEKSGRAKTSG